MHPHLTLVPPLPAEPVFFETKKAACVEGPYRYSLSRWWCDELPMDLWVMLNPSTADATIDDRTIGRCMAFSYGWGAGGIAVVNLYAYRATDPRALRAASVPVVGEKNDQWIDTHLRTMDPERSKVIVGWGATARGADRVVEVYEIIRERGFTPLSLGRTKSGAPRHPLYVKGDTVPLPWSL